MIVRTEEELRAKYGSPQELTVKKIHSALTSTARDFISRSPMVMLATVSPNGRLEVSPKGDDPGFVHIFDDTTLLIPDRTGNRLIMGLLNIIHNPQVSLIFLVPNSYETLRVSGRAELIDDPAINTRLAARGRPSLLAIRVSIDECFFHCGRAFARAHMWDPASWGERLTVDWIEEIKGQKDPVESPQLAKIYADDLKGIEHDGKEPAP